MASNQKLVKAAKEDHKGRLRGALDSWITTQEQQNGQERKLFITDGAIENFIERNVVFSIEQNRDNSVTYSAKMNDKAVLLVAKSGNIGKGAVGGGAGGAVGGGAGLVSCSQLLRGWLHETSAGLGALIAYAKADKIPVQIQSLKDHINGKVEATPPQIIVTCTFTLN